MLRLSLVIGWGWRRIEVTVLPPGVVNGAVPATFATVVMERALDVPTFLAELDRPVGTEVPVDAMEV